MDDDGSKKLDFDEFKKGIHDYGLLVEDAVSIDTVPYDAGLEAPFAHSLHSVYFRKFTPCCLPRLNPNHCDRLVNLGPPNSIYFFL